jgi:hypothetical protein
MGRRWIGIDLAPRYLEAAARNINAAPAFDPLLIVGRPKYPTKDELLKVLEEEAETNGSAAVKKHKRRTYGRSVPLLEPTQLNLV